MSLADEIFTTFKPRKYFITLRNIYYSTTTWEARTYVCKLTWLVIRVHLPLLILP